MNLTKRNEVWWVDFRNAAGRRVRLSTGETDKLAATERAVAIVREAGTVAPSGGLLTLGEALDRTYKQHWSKAKSERVMRCMVGLLTREVGHWPVAEVTYARLKNYCEGLRLGQKMAPATVNRRMSTIGVVLRECARRGEIVARPDLPHYAENNTKERYMTVAEETAVLDWLDRQAAAEVIRGDSDKADEWRYIRGLATVLLDTGLRWSEVYKATLSGTTLDLGHGKTKTGAGRRVPLTSRAADYWGRIVANPCHALVRAKGDHAGMSWCAHRWEMATKANDCRDVTIHILRHTCASRLVQKGVPIFTVSKWLGHSSVKITERYAKLAPDSLSQALAALEGRPTVVESSHDTRLLQTCADSTDECHALRA